MNASSQAIPRTASMRPRASDSALPSAQVLAKLEKSSIIVDDVEEGSASVKRLVCLASSHRHLITTFARVIQHWLPLNAALSDPKEAVLRRMQCVCFSGILDLSCVGAISIPAIPSFAPFALGCIFRFHVQILESEFEMTDYREHLLAETCHALVALPWLRSELLTDALTHSTLYRAWIKAASDDAFHVSLIGDHTDSPFVFLSEVAEYLYHDICCAGEHQGALVSRWDDAVENTPEDVFLSCAYFLVREFQLCGPQVHNALFFAYLISIQRSDRRFVLLSKRTLHWACQLLAKLVRLATSGPPGSGHPACLDAAIMHLMRYLAITASFGPRCTAVILSSGSEVLSALLWISSSSAHVPLIAKAGEKQAAADIFRTIGGHLLNPTVFRLFRRWTSRVVACSEDTSVHPLVLSALKDVRKELDSIQEARIAIRVESFRLCRLPSCGKSNTKKHCKACQTETYCDSVCQKQDWRRHRPLCKATVEAHEGGRNLPLDGDRHWEQGFFEAFFLKQAFDFREDFKLQAHTKFPNVHPSELLWIWDYRTLPRSVEVDAADPGLRSELENIGRGGTTLIVWMPPWDPTGTSDDYWVTPMPLQTLYG